MEDEERQKRWNDNKEILYEDHADDDKTRYNGFVIPKKEET